VPASRLQQREQEPQLAHGELADGEAEFLIDDVEGVVDAGLERVAEGWVAGWYRTEGGWPTIARVRESDSFLDRQCSPERPRKALVGAEAAPARERGG
jgi:hypothetical protein